VEEALYLSSRVVVITARPSRIRRVIEVPFPYPRREELHRHPGFAELEYELRELVMQEYVDQERQKDVSLTA
jgi:NitT/TauT family transport system ATP-binding protein